MYHTLLPAQFIDGYISTTTYYPEINFKAHVKTEWNYGEGIRLRAGQDAPPTVSVAHFLNMSQL